MRLKVRPYHTNLHPLKGLFIRGNAVREWLLELQQLHLTPDMTRIYPLPGSTPNSIWGCLVLIDGDLPDSGRHERCQAVHQNLLIPERSAVSPHMSPGEMDGLFTRLLVFHPETGWCEPHDPLRIETLLTIPGVSRLSVTKPEARVFIPQTVNSFQVRPVAPEKALEQLEKQFFPQQEPKNEAPLNGLEKLKLTIYRTLLGRKAATGGENVAFGRAAAENESRFSAFLRSLMPKIRLIGRMEEDLEDLERRNQKQIDKLMELFRTNPEEALKYAVPLDGRGTSRGTPGAFDLSRRWSGFNLFGSGEPNRSSHSSVVTGDYFEKLRQQYHRTAEKLIAQGDYRKAAFVYLKLLTDHQTAAKTLENGRFYQDAAALYLACKDESKAAACYENGHMYREAIDLYKKLGQHEKAGDLYRITGNRLEADHHFQLQIEKYLSQTQYIKAAEVYKTKMQDADRSQEMLLEGWRRSREGEQCLSLYFGAIVDQKDLWHSISAVHRNDVDSNNRRAFLKVLHGTYKQREELSEQIRDMAYGVIAAEAERDPQFVTELRLFNPGDQHIRKDTQRFLLRRKK